MLVALLLLALLALVFGLVTAVKWLIIVAAILFVVGLVSGFAGRRNDVL